MAQDKIKYKLIATDLDGTLLDSRKRIPAKNAAALRRAHSLGAHIVMATGRPPRAASWVFKELGIDGVVVGSGGACVERFPSGETLFEEYMDAEAVRDFALYCRERDYFTFCMRGSDYYYEYEGPRADYIRKYMHYDGFRADFVSGGGLYNKADALVSDPADTRRVTEELSALLKGRAQPVIADRDIIDINPLGVDKGTALARLAPLLGCELAETMAFGDTDNDVEMLRAAGLGVCMGNGMPAALAAADLVAPSNDEAGVARIIEEYI